MKEKLKFDKTSKVIIYILIIYTIAMLAIFLPSYLYRRGKFYIVTNFYKIKYVDGNWYNVTNNNDFNLKQFNVYQGNSPIGNYKLVYSDKIFLLDDENNKVDYSGDILGYSGRFKMDVLNVDLDKESDLSDIEVCKKAIEKAKIENVSDYEIKQKAVIDIDNDGYNESVYNVSNNMISDSNTLEGYRATNDSTIFSLLFMYKDDNIVIIDKKVNNNIGAKVFELSEFIDFRSDNKIELLYLDKFTQTDAEQCVKMYSLTNNKLIHNFCK